MYRRLGIEEHTLWLYDQAAPLHFTVTAKVVGELLIDQLQQALAWVQQRHPLLRVRIVLDSSGRPWLIEDSTSIPLRIVQRQNEQQWLSEVEQEIFEPFDWNQAPLIRMVLVHAADISELIITCHHAITDGMSTVYLLRDILEAVGIPDSQRQILPERPAYEYLTPIAQEIQHPAEKPLLESTNSSNIKPVVPANCRPRLLSWSLSPQETATLIHHCQQEQTSVHAAICAAFLLAITQQNDTDAQKQDLKQPATLKCFVPINIRQFLNPPIQEDFGYYFTTIVTAHTVAPNLSLWDLARAIKSQLKQKMSPEQIFAHLPEAQAFISTLPSADVVKQVLQEINGYDVLISNLGRLNIPQQYGHLQLAAIYGPSATTHIESDRFVGVATLGDKMFFNLLYSESDISPVQSEQLQQEAMQLLKLR